MGHFVSGAEGKTTVFLEIWRKQRPKMHLSGSRFEVSVRTPDYRPFSLVPGPIRHTIRGGGAEHPHFRAMPAIAAALVRRQKRMRIWLRATKHTSTLRRNLRCA
jgi:hypothetical protein